MQVNQSPMNVAAYTPAPVGTRFAAAVIDALVIVVVSAVLGFVSAGIGGLVGPVYGLIRDGLFDGRSVGKKVMGLKVINVETGAPCSYAESAIRHVVSLIPCVGVLYAGAEIYMVLTKADRRRFGDQWAKTMVIPG